MISCRPVVKPPTAPPKALPTEHVDDLLPAGGEAAHGAAEGLAEGAGEDVDAAVAAELLGDAVAGRADDTGGVALVDHHQGVVLLREVADLVHRGDVAVHGEDAVGDDDAEAAGLGLLELGLEVRHVGVGVTETLGLAKADAVDDGGVVQGVGDDGILGGQERLEHAAVGVEAGRIEDGVIGMEIVGDGFLEFLVDVLGTADEADGGHAVAARIDRFLGGLREPGAVGEAEIVVGAEVQGLAAVLEGDLGALGRGDVAFSLVKTGLLDGFQFVLEVLLEFSVHDIR